MRGRLNNAELSIAFSFGDEQGAFFCRRNFLADQSEDVFLSPLDAFGEQLQLGPLIGHRETVNGFRIVETRGTLPEYQRMGFGQRMLDCLESRAKKLGLAFSNWIQPCSKLPQGNPTKRTATNSSVNGRRPGLSNCYSENMSAGRNTR